MLRSFSYCMVEEAPEYRNCLWTRDGQVMYQSSRFTTPWHGSCFIDSKGTMRIRFHFKGNLQKVRTTNLVQVAPGVWQGRDYKLRFIEMQLLDTFRPVDDGDDLEDGADDEWVMVTPLLAIEDRIR